MTLLLLVSLHVVAGALAFAAGYFLCFWIYG